MSRRSYDTLECFSGNTGVSLQWQHGTREPIKIGFFPANDIFGLPAALVGCLSQGSTDGEAKMFFAC